MIIEDQEVEFENETYIWSYNDTHDKSQSFTWMRARDYSVPPTSILEKLNRQFIDKHAASITNSLDEKHKEQFAQVLRSMSATNEDLKTAGLEVALLASDPDYRSRCKFEELPPAGHTPFNCATLRDWLFGEYFEKPNIDAPVACLGDSPFEQPEFEEFLVSRGIACTHNSQTCGYLILGREGWDGEEIDEIIEDHVGKCLRVYSQEMFLSFLIRDSDPFLAGSDVLDAFRSGHAGLEFVSQGWRGWVRTFVRRDYRSASRSSGFDAKADESPLHRMGYKVGKSGERQSIRREILSAAFLGPLPPVKSSEYMQQWGEPETSQRLKKIAENIASYCANAKNRANVESMSQAIADWEADLDWLKESYYHGRMLFPWPDIHVYAG